MKKRNAALKFLAAAGVAAFTTAPAMAEINLGLDRIIAPSAPSGDKPWVNIRIYDLDFLAGGAFDALAPTVEFQVSTKQFTFDDPLTGDASCCVMPGRGNLAGNEELITLNMTVNPSLLAVADSELIVEWAGGAPGFPDAGQAPAAISISDDPSVDPYDITISWNVGTNVTHSKFLVTYKVGGVVTDIDAADLAFVNQTGYSAQGVVLYKNNENLITGAGVIGAVPEPETYAMLGLGLIGIGLATRRRR
ncbi:MAG: PEP-CTERM sorting domain-containing protein [Betaproteobacteria bacterium]|nr:PEP-CTERM sorting domain-containing protein [Betaproteobacteria bacterium]